MPSLEGDLLKAKVTTATAALTRAHVDRRQFTRERTEITCIKPRGGHKACDMGVALDTGLHSAGRNAVRYSGVAGRVTCARKQTGMGTFLPPIGQRGRTQGWGWGGSPAPSRAAARSCKCS